MPTYHYLNKDEPHGIIKSLQRKYGTDASKYISIYSNSILNSNVPLNIFKFDSSIWASNSSVQEPYITFCFTHYKIKLEGYQFHPNDGGCRFKNWTLYASSTPEIMEESVNTEKLLRVNELQYYETNFKPHQCFKIKHHGNSQCNIYQADVRWIEMYGSIQNLGYFTCKCRKNERMILSLIMFVIL